MDIILTRIAKCAIYTIGYLYAVSPDGTQQYLCDTLEPTWRDYARGEKKTPRRP